MKLYYFPGACSQAPHMVAREAGVELTLEKVNTQEMRTETGADYTKINPKGYVPVLQLPDGTHLTEAAVIIQYLADQKPESGLLAKPGTLERYRHLEWLNYIATELHKTFRPLIKGAAPEVQAYAKELLAPQLEFVSQRLTGQDYLFGASFTAPDAYLAVVLGWTRFIKYDTSRWPLLNPYISRVRARPAVRAVLKAEGLLKEG